MMKAAHRMILLGAGLSLSACFDDDTTGIPTAKETNPGEGLGGEPGVVELCLSCHSEIREAWSQPSSHEVLFDCKGCHDLGGDFTHEVPISLPSCERCHSESVHPKNGAACTTCHDPHGSTNLFLIRSSIVTPAGESVSVDFTSLAGAGPGGLVRAGVEGEVAGTGLCEVCHVATQHYNRSGTGAPHATKWCADCHDHQSGFAPSGNKP